MFYVRVKYRAFVFVEPEPSGLTLLEEVQLVMTLIGVLAFLLALFLLEGVTQYY
jgi:hypothetical protein